ncbi:hypothetical protein HW555_005430 [Spodoptera exigua]|uniref:Uncharacterized protein n=1 Tax=Spodoptera exigua TaxID=7107 RepID=A0A835GJU5_SPOEX|nr:hypothetical protein HW555_005430 [Spodoptera exigua]
MFAKLYVELLLAQQHNNTIEPPLYPPVSPRCRSRLSPKFDTNHTSQSDDLKVHEINIDTTKRLLPHVLVDSPVAEIPLSLLVDSGSAICLLKHSSISKHPRLIKEPIKLKGIDPGDEPTTTEDPLALNDNDLLPLPEIEPAPESSEIPKENTKNNLPSTTGCSSTPDAPATTPLVQQPNANPEIVNDLPDLFDDNYPAFLKTIARKDNISFNTMKTMAYNMTKPLKHYNLIKKKLALLIKENILVTTSVLTQYNATLSKIIENEANSKEAIDKLSTNIRNITEMTNGLQIQASVNEVINALETSILTLSFQLENIINAILFSSQNILHPAIATPTQLHKELADNYRHLPSDLELPVPLDIKSIYIILSISNNKVIFILQVPMVKTQGYVLFHNIALPTPHNTSNPNSFSLILPDYKYLAMTKDKSFYCAFNSLEICKTVTPGNYICDIENVYSTEAKPICESELLTKPEPDLETTNRQTDCEDSTPNMSNIAPLRITI